MRIGQKLSFPFVIIIIGNAVTCFKEGDRLSGYLLYSAIFIPLLILINIKKINPNDKVIGYSLLLISLFGFSVGGAANVIGATALCFSIYILRPKRSLIYVFSLTALILLMIRYTAIGKNPMQATVFLAGASVVCILYQHYIHPKPEQPSSIVQKVYDPGSVNNDVVDIVHLHVQGFDWHEINDKLELNVRDSRVPVKVREEWKRHGFSNLPEFIFWMTINGVITSKLTDDEIAAEKRDNL